MNKHLARAICNKLIEPVLITTIFLNKIILRFSRIICRLSSYSKYCHHPSDALFWVALQYPEYTGIDVMIETGTFMGDTAFYERRRFKCIHTIEISEDLYNQAKTRLSPYPNIICHYGNSAEILGGILEGIKERAVFFLDAHWSGDASVDWMRSNWKGYSVDTGFSGKRERDGSVSSEHQVPLRREISLIAKEHPYASVIIIDDFCSIGKKDHGFLGEDWTCVSIEDILSILGEKRIRAFFTLDESYTRSRAHKLVILLRQK